MGNPFRNQKVEVAALKAYKNNPQFPNARFPFLSPWLSLVLLSRNLPGVVLPLPWLSDDQDKKRLPVLNFA